MRRKRRGATGPVVVITGAGRGIGEATARLLHARGRRVVVTDVDTGAAVAVADDLGDGAWGLGLDVTDRAAFTALLDQVETRWSSVDVLVNNAGIMPLSRTAEEAPELTRAIIEINLVAVIESTKELVARWQRQGRGGHVVNISSAAAKVALPGAATYTATKHGVTGFTNALHLELHATRSPIRVTALHPGMVATDIASGLAAPAPGMGAVGPERIAKGVLSAIRRPRANVYVPGFLGPALSFQALNPPGVKEWASHRFGGEATLDAVDAPDRRGYVERVSGRVQGARPPGDDA